MEKPDTVIIKDKKKTKIMAKQDLTEQKLGERMLIEDFEKDNIEFLD